MALVEFQNGTIPYLNATNLNKIQEGNIYSTNEIEIGEFKGNKLYRKVLEINSLSQGSNTITVGDENTDLIMVDLSHSYVQHIGTGLLWPVIQKGLTFQGDMGELNITAENALTYPMKIIITVEYIKNEN